MYKFFVGTSEYSLATQDERKMAFFELWHLLSVPKMFEDSFGTHLIEPMIPVIFENVDGLNQSMLDFVKAQFSVQELGRTEYSKLVILLAILVQEQKLNCHKDGIAQLIRDGVLERLFVLSTKTDDSIFTDYQYWVNKWQLIIYDTSAPSLLYTARTYANTNSAYLGFNYAK